MLVLLILLLEIKVRSAQTNSINGWVLTRLLNKNFNLCIHKCFISLLELVGLTGGMNKCFCWFVGWFWVLLPERLPKAKGDHSGFGHFLGFSLECLLF